MPSQSNWKLLRHFRNWSCPKWRVMTSCLRYVTCWRQWRLVDLEESLDPIATCFSFGLLFQIRIARALLTNAFTPSQANHTMEGPAFSAEPDHVASVVDHSSARSYDGDETFTEGGKDDQQVRFKVTWYLLMKWITWQWPIIFVALLLSWPPLIAAPGAPIFVRRVCFVLGCRDDYIDGADSPPHPAEQTEKCWWTGSFK